MDHLSLEILTERLVAQSRGAHEELCRPILHQITRGKPLAPTTLAASLQVSQSELERRLEQFPDLEYDHAGQIVGLGVTLVPTSHRVQVRGQRLFTWCAFDTLLLPCTWRHRLSQRARSLANPLHLSPLLRESSRT